MGKWSKGILIVIASVLSSWLLVSGVFYYHHRVSDKTMKISGFNLDPFEYPVMVKEVRLVNKTETGAPIDYISSFRQAVFNTKYLSDSTKFFIMRVLAFYNLPYESKNSWYLEVSGAYLTPDSWKQEDFPKFNLTVDGNSIFSNSYEENGHVNSNLRFFKVKAQRVNPDLKIVTLNWNLKGIKGKQSFLTSFKNNTYSFFQNKPNFFLDIDPSQAAVKAFYNYYENKDGEDAVLMPGLSDNLKWAKEYRRNNGKKNISISSPNVTYINNYNGIIGVIAVELNYIFDTGGLGEITDDKIHGSQVFYLIEYKGKWKIIDVSTYKRL